MSCTVFIPARGGSKSIPLKNVGLMAGRPLIHWVMAAADECPLVDDIVVSTDSDEIEAVAHSFGSPKVRIHRRTADSASDTAATEQVMLEYARSHDDFDTMVLVQATSPLLTAEDVTGALTLFGSVPCDSLVSVVRQKRFEWRQSDLGAVPVNYDVAWRPRRQDHGGSLIENGALYITTRSALLASGCRLSGRIVAYEMGPTTYHEVDEADDWDVVEALLRRREHPSHVPRTLHAAGVRAVLTDCDGVLTDGGMYYSETGDELKRFSARDGMGFERLRKAGIVVGVITSESVDLVRRRAEKLELDIVLLGVRDKLAAVQAICSERSLSMADIAYVGDDVLDVPLIGAVGLGCSTADGTVEARSAAAYVTRARGGHGAFREVAELVLASQR